MTIEIVGATGGSERDAANQLRTVLDSFIGNNQLSIVVGAKCYGEEVQDIDLLLLGTFGRGISYISPLTGQQTTLVNLCLIVEVKDHSSSGIKFSGQHALVKYQNKNYWDDATEKLHKQKSSLKNYLRRNDLAQPWIEGLLWLRNYRGTIPDPCQNVLGAGLSLENFLIALEQTRQPRSGQEGPYIAFTTNATLRAIQSAKNYFSRELTQTPLDRRRLEEICKKLVSDQKYVKELGNQILIFRGRGGSGKTIHLLRLAKGLYDRGDRILFITYNKALVADIKRLLTIQGLLAQNLDRGIHITTAHKYFMGLADVFSLWNPPAGGPFPSKEYDNAKSQLLSLISGDTPESLREDPTILDNPDSFNWDYILVDEGQDWPEDERDILFHVFGPNRCIVADGVDQLARQQVRCDWTGSKLTRSRQTVGLSRSMRMKSNLCRFVRALASQLNVEWDQEVNEEITGGRVTIVCGEYTEQLHNTIFADHFANGNLPIDALMCVGPSSDHAGDPTSRLSEWGHKIWNGTDADVRDTFPSDNDQFRIVKYESCRGLEGWTVVCHAFDRFHAHKLHFAERRPDGELFSDEEYARIQANQWLLIPLTRAIDHLVLQVSEDSHITDVLRQLHEQYGDFVSWTQSGGV